MQLSVAGPAGLAKMVEDRASGLGRTSPHVRLSSAGDVPSPVCRLECCAAAPKTRVDEFRSPVPPTLSLPLSCGLRELARLIVSVRMAGHQFARDQHTPVTRPRSCAAARWLLVVDWIVRPTVLSDDRARYAFSINRRGFCSYGQEADVAEVTQVLTLCY